jgi:hypothetical protein
MDQATGTFTTTVLPGAPPPALTMTPQGGALPTETQGTQILDPVCTISGGVPPYTFSISAGALPPGTQLVSTDNPAEGTTVVSLEGTPTTPGDYSFDLTVTDNAAS